MEMSSNEVGKTMEGKKNLTDLPSETIENIIGRLSFQSLCRLSQVNLRLSKVCNDSNEIWRLMFMRSHPYLYENVYAKLPDEEIANDIDWKIEVRLRLAYGQMCLQLVKLLPEECHREKEVSDETFVNFVKHHEELGHRFGTFFQIDALEDIVKDGKPNENLTIKYYAEKALRYLKHSVLSNRWREYISTSGFSNLDPNDQNDLNDFQAADLPGDLIAGAVILSSWCQSNDRIDERSTRVEVERIANAAVQQLMVADPSNSMLTERQGKVLTDQEAFGLRDSLHEPSHCRTILLAINNVMYHDNEFKYISNDEFYYEAENSYIDRVVERRTGIPITLSLLYQAVAAKLGVKTYAINNPGHFLLAWKEHPHLTAYSAQFTFIDAYREGHMDQHLPIGADGDHPVAVHRMVAKPLATFRRMASNLIEVGRQQEASNDGLLCLRNGLELMALISPTDNEPLLLLCRVYIHLSINQEAVGNLLDQVLARDPNATGIVMFLRSSTQEQMSLKRKEAEKGLVPKRHTLNRDVMFTIGMVMRHKKFDYNCLIYSWDPTCCASKDWIEQMGVKNLKDKDKQPFYNVLACDGSNRYAAQENLEVASKPKPITHCEVGRYFSRFNGKFYEPNPQSEAEFPEDGKFRDDLFAGSTSNE